MPERQAFIARSTCISRDSLRIWLPHGANAEGRWRDRNPASTHLYRLRVAEEVDHTYTNTGRRIAWGNNGMISDGKGWTVTGLGCWRVETDPAFGEIDGVFGLSASQQSAGSRAGCAELQGMFQRPQWARGGSATGRTGVLQRASHSWPSTRAAGCQRGGLGIGPSQRRPNPVVVICNTAMSQLGAKKKSRRRIPVWPILALGATRKSARRSRNLSESSPRPAVRRSSVREALGSAGENLLAGQ